MLRIGALQQLCSRLVQLALANRDLARQHAIWKAQPVLVALAIEFAECLRLLLDLVAM